jgi:hypothetical protein
VPHKDELSRYVSELSVVVEDEGVFGGKETDYARMV